ncbi:hypothetical protein ACIZ1P_06370 [Pseudomonas guariconensis]|uniref:hypothetical protein n=1 Tax=Pseudomonas guariconensis TaxID=1288410 RepID=UPI003F68D689
MNRIFNWANKWLNNLEKPWSSTWRYTSAAVGLSLLASLVSIFLIWFTTTPFFDIRKFFALAWQQIVIFRVSLMLGLIGLVIVWGIFKRNTSTTITCALLIKLITGSYMTALLTSAISSFIVEHFEWGAWTDALPWASVYPSIALPFTVFLWGGDLVGGPVLAQTRQSAGGACGP